ncbi:hypothetical protein LEMLEM_LOCUS13585 [Lemmus lemmus]
MTRYFHHGLSWPQLSFIVGDENGKTSWPKREEDLGDVFDQRTQRVGGYVPFLLAPWPGPKADGPNPSRERQCQICLPACQEE